MEPAQSRFFLTSMTSSTLSMVLVKSTRFSKSLSASPTPGEAAQMQQAQQVDGWDDLEGTVGMSRMRTWPQTSWTSVHELG